MSKKQKTTESPTESPTETSDRHMLIYNNTTKFLLVHYTNIIITQNWVCVKGLKIRPSEKKAHEKSMTQFCEYFLSESPIKAVEKDGFYWIVDGHHRFYRGRMLGHKYFLIENNHLYRPCNGFNRTTQIDILKNGRPESNEPCGPRGPVDKFSKDHEKIISQFMNIIDPDISIQRFV
jgi:hypothetical protein